MGAEPSEFGVFYRRFEDEVLGYFLARGVEPAVAADLTAETFAAVIPRRRWQRLAREARGALEASRREGYVVARARRRRQMPPLVLTDDTATRIAAVDPISFALSPELLDEQGDVRAHVIDEDDFAQPASSLRSSDAVVRRRATAPDDHHGDTPRIPQLERDLVVAAERVLSRRRRAVLAAAALAATLAVVVALTRNDSDVPSSSHANATGASLVQPARASEDEITRTGNAWAPRFAVSSQGGCAEPMTQPACERVTCESVRGPVESCVPLSRTVRRSFRRAYVRDVVVDGRRAAVLFSNGEIVDLVTGRTSWMVDGIDRDVGRRVYHEAKIALAANAWARFFAASGRRECPEHMTPSACEQARCESFVTGPVEDCVPISADVKHAFRGATVQDVLVLEGRRAAVEFSNGEVVALVYSNDAGGQWLVDGFGRDAVHGPG